MIEYLQRFGVGVVWMVEPCVVELMAVATGGYGMVAN
jgi:hypothetical protein